MNGILLNSRTGRPETKSGLPTEIQENMERGWKIRGLNDSPPDLSNLPDHIQHNLIKARETAGPFSYRASNQGWEELLYATVADGAQVIATTTETIMVPDFTLPAYYLYPGRVLRYTVFFDCSTVVTTPGTIILSLHYGGVAGTLLAASSAFAPKTTVSTTLTGWVEFYFVCRAVGTAAASFTIGRMWLSQFDLTSATTLAGNMAMLAIPAAAPAAVNINTTTANALSPTVKFSVTTATTQFTAHIATLESLS